MVRTLEELIEGQMEVNSHPVPTEETVGTSVVKVLSNNPNRVGLTFVNLSTNTIYLWLDPQVSTSRAIRLAPLGGALSLNWQYDMTLISNAWYAVASGASSPLAILGLETL